MYSAGNGERIVPMDGMDISWGQSVNNSFHFSTLTTPPMGVCENTILLTPRGGRDPDDAPPVGLSTSPEELSIDGVHHRFTINASSIY